MDLEKEKLAIIKWVTTIKDETSIERLKLLKHSGAKTEWWDEISEGEQLSIDKGLSDVKAGKIKSHRSVRKKYERWL